MKLDRSIFLYLEPSPLQTRGAPFNPNRFAQCMSCRDWVYGDLRCRIHGPKVKVPGSASCGFYIPGLPKEPGTRTWTKVTPEESGLVNRQVRCENCKWGDDGATVCGLYKLLNEKFPELFDLDTSIKPKACCNAQTPV